MLTCLQFAPQVGDVDNNLNRADAVLSKANPQKLDLLVLPELAFTGKSGFKVPFIVYFGPESAVEKQQLSGSSLSMPGKAGLQGIHSILFKI
jgi:predicted amidohydrolase